MRRPQLRHVTGYLNDLGHTYERSGDAVGVAETELDTLRSACLYFLNVTKSDVRAETRKRAGEQT